ncbi:glucose-6-phosphate dehydrogenase [Carnobacteriaceae bacterium zg-ZUI240]|nr:glucose-6-phosphate dehydrogenase [Carnobacteriaceae bacterium zg-ZUI240]
MNKTKDIPVLITLFGATGDLAKRKLYPALFRLFKKGFLQNRFAVIGTARREWTHDFFRNVVLESISKISGETQEKEAFVQHFFYQAHNVNNVQEYNLLKNLATSLDEQFHLENNRIFYLAMAPEFFGTISKHLKGQQLLSDNGFNRLIIEKPFGTNLETAIELNDQLAKTFHEDQIYRIDHYLGKEMVQNINALRYSNVLFEAMWNNKYIDNVQITLAESVGVEERAGYYDTSGALRDMVQNHIFQILSLLVMEPPVRMNGTEVRREKVKALRSLRIEDEQSIQKHFVRAQYISNGTEVGYLDEQGVAENSRTETFVAGKIMIDNFRWSGVPFYIRTGKRLQSKNTVVHIQFKPLTMNLFKSNTNQEIAPNVLTFHIQPENGVSLNLNIKEPGLSKDIVRSPLVNIINEADTKDIPEAYERLILECLNGHTTNFAHREEVELSWQFIDTIRNAWDNDTTSTIPTYVVGTMGPSESHDLLAEDGFVWHSCDTTHCL